MPQPKAKLTEKPVVMSGKMKKVKLLQSAQFPSDDKVSAPGKIGTIDAMVASHWEANKICEIMGDT